MLPVFGKMMITLMSQLSLSYLCANEFEYCVVVIRQSGHQLFPTAT